MKACYNANPRPDALMKEQMVEMTGLNSRVIRVWFQNKRCKDKKRTIAKQCKVRTKRELSVSKSYIYPYIAISTLINILCAEFHILYLSSTGIQIDFMPQTKQMP